jgi:hypothetical protein
MKDNLQTCPCCDWKWTIDTYLSKWDHVYFDRLKWMTYRELCEKYNFKSLRSVWQYIKSREKKYWVLQKMKIAKIK